MNGKTYIDPYRLWHGAHVPEWLMQRPEVSPGAKLAYSRLCRYAGRRGEAHPRQEELASELGISERQVRRYLTDLIEHGLIDVDRRGLRKSNVYRFPAHKWMGLDGTHVSAQDRTPTARQERSQASGPASLVMSQRERSHRSPLEERIAEAFEGLESEGVA